MFVNGLLHGEVTTKYGMSLREGSTVHGTA